MSQVNIKAMSLTFSIFWGLSVGLLGLLAHFLHYGTRWVSFLSDVYLGYSSAPLGILAGMLWGIVDGLVWGAFIAWIYSRVSKLMEAP